MDRRQKKTKTAIYNAFIRLLAQKDFHRITVQEIIDEADVGRATFYAHFETKEYLLKGLCEELFNHILGASEGKSVTSPLYADCRANNPVFLHLLRHIQQNDDKLLTLLSCRNNDLFLQYFKAGLQDMLRRQFATGQAVNKTALPEEFLVDHIASTFIETLTWWVNHPTQPPEDTVAYFFAVLEGLVAFPAGSEYP